MILKFTSAIKKFSQTTKQQFVAAFAAGLCSAFAFAPFHFFVAAIISISAFYLLIEKKTKTPKQAFYLGLAYGYGYFLSGVYWISISLLVDAAQFGWLIPFALTLIPGFLAIFFAAPAALFKIIEKEFSPKFSYQKILIFSLLWLAFEALRSVVFTGFPWNLIGYSLLFSTYAIQLSSVFSIYGLSFFVTIACLTATLFIKPSKHDKIFIVTIIFLIISNFIFGYLRIKNTTLIENENLQMRLVQGNIKQDLKWNPQEKYHGFLKHIVISSAVENKNLKAVIWSETAVPYVINDHPDLLDLLKQAIPQDAILITGGLNIEYDASRLEIKNIWNGVFAISHAGIIDNYDKHHLVPFGEYIPFAKYLPFLQSIAGGSGFNEGNGPKTITTPHFSFSPLICYEVIFAGEIIDKNNRPDLLVNVTNDAWFGASSGPYQHLDAAKMRAAEYGISLARSANTGISAYIDPFGNIIKQIHLNKEGFIDVNFIEKISPTIFSKFSYWPLSLLALAILLFLIISIRRKK